MTTTKQKFFVVIKTRVWLTTHKLQGGNKSEKIRQNQKFWNMKVFRLRDSATAN